MFYLSEIPLHTMKEDDLQKQLEDWEIDVPDDPHFRASVWREISIREKSSAIERFREILEKLLSVRVATPVAICAMFAILVAASLHGRHSREQTWDRLAMAYKSPIDPIFHTEVKSSSERH